MVCIDEGKYVSLHASREEIVKLLQLADFVQLSSEAQFILDELTRVSRFSSHGKEIVK